MVTPELARRELDYLLEFIYARADRIIEAHIALGVPLEDLLLSTINHAANRKASDDHQLKLLDELKEGK